MKNTFSDPNFFSYRTLWGSLAGILTALMIIIFFRQTTLVAPLFSLIVASWISQLIQPKNLAGLALIIGLPAGLAASIQYAFNLIQIVDLVTLLEAYFNASFFFVFYVVSFVFAGFYYGQIIRLYRRGALF